MPSKLVVRALVKSRNGTASRTWPPAHFPGCFARTVRRSSLFRWQVPLPSRETPRGHHPSRGAQHFLLSDCYLLASQRRPLSSLLALLPLPPLANQNKRPGTWRPALLKPTSNRCSLDRSRSECLLSLWLVVLRLAVGMRGVRMRRRGGPVRRMRIARIGFVCRRTRLRRFRVACGAC